ncbi:hypothetical protein HHK36_019871 [Tetracentron sinense]|uniref:RING-type E3 ubiquitin transferase n=1 Tax=Tetracentron sinense TaxID=13715 RepID=A0A834Z249_TETSI|nr:hypothetical protein HHK36_019871 [Tetracentron sinense]
MASSLEELLAEEGFKERKMKTKSRASFGSKAVSMPLYLVHDYNQLGSASGVKIKTERTRSDLSRQKSRSEFPSSERVRSRRPKDTAIGSERLVEGLKKEFKETERFEGRYSNDVHEVTGSYVGSLGTLPGNEIVDDLQEIEDFKDIYSHEELGSERGRNKFSKGFEDKEKYRERSRKDIQGDKKYNNSNNKNLLGCMSLGDNYLKSMQQPEASHGKTNKISQNRKSFEEIRSRRHLYVEKTVSEPAIDEVAIQAIISILTGYIRRFLKDEDFRTSLCQTCSSFLNITKLEEGQHSDGKVIASLEQAMEIVGRVAEESANAKELKKASLQLSVITGLNSKDLKDGFTSGIPNSRLSACAHLYLSVIYKLQKKNRVSAKHLLQVFCDSPFKARTNLLPELWDNLFLPHLSHLRVWYNQEAESIPDTPNRPRKLKLLEEVYNEILDSGTYQFAVYYKDWLTEGVEAPTIPSIHVPSISVRGVSRGHSPDLASPIGPVSPQPMVSRKLYNAVFCHNLDEVDELEDGEEEDNFDNHMRSSEGTAEEDKHTATYSTDTGKYTGQLIEEDPTKITQAVASHPADGLLLTTEEALGLHRVSAPGNTHMLHTLTHAKANELTLKELAKSVFHLQQTEDSVDLTVPDSCTNRSNIRSCVEELHGNCEYFDEGSFFSSIPKDFICPLTGLLFEDPVTLETGQTFERVAIRDWFDQGNRTCPITGRTLGSLAVPITNFVLKRVIDSWKSEHCRNILACASQIAGNSGEHGFKSKHETAILILEQLLTGLSKEERITNARHLISLGGLQFLVRSFELGNLEEKTRVAALLSCCIEADGGCRNYLARNITKPCLLELLHSKQVKSRTNAVLLLTELICLNRRKEVISFLSGLKKEGIMNTMHVLLVYLHSCPLEQRSLVAVLLLLFDLLIEPRKYSIYREEAVDTITVALDCCLTDEKVRAQCCRALLILGGHFSFSGKVSTENWLLKQAGFYDAHEVNSPDNSEEGLQIDEAIPWEEEEKAREEWLKNLATSLLGNGKKSFLETISKCLRSENSDLVKVCLITVAWLSRALASLSDGEFQLSAFSALIPRLKESLENGERVEHKVLASMSLLNFSKISECRVLLTTIADEIMVPLRNLAQVTWTAKQLHAVISGEDI